MPSDLPPGDEVGAPERVAYIIPAVVDPDQEATVPFAPGTPLSITFYPCQCHQPGQTCPCAGCLAAVNEAGAS
jgi:hypothetical protein